MRLHVTTKQKEMKRKVCKPTSCKPAKQTDEQCSQAGSAAAIRQCAGGRARRCAERSAGGASQRELGGNAPSRRTSGLGKCATCIPREIWCCVYTFTVCNVGSATGRCQGRWHMHAHAESTLKPVHRATLVARDKCLPAQGAWSASILWAYPSPALLRAAPISAVCTHVCTPPISLCQSARVYCTCAPWGVSCAQQRPPSAASASRWCREKKRKHHMPCLHSPPHTAGADS